MYSHSHAHVHTYTRTERGGDGEKKKRGREEERDIHGRLSISDPKQPRKKDGTMQRNDSYWLPSFPWASPLWEHVYFSLHWPRTHMDPEKVWVACPRLNFITIRRRSFSPSVSGHWTEPRFACPPGPNSPRPNFPRPKVKAHRRNALGGTCGLWASGNTPCMTSGPSLNAYPGLLSDPAAPILEPGGVAVSPLDSMSPSW
jgi:hypothetical protein